MKVCGQTGCFCFARFSFGSWIFGSARRQPRRRGCRRLKAFVSILSFRWGQFRFRPCLLCEGLSNALHFPLAHFHDLELGSLPPTDSLDVVTLRSPFLNSWLADVVILRFAGGFLRFGKEEAESSFSRMSWSPTANARIGLVGLKGGPLSVGRTTCCTNI